MNAKAPAHTIASDGVFSSATQLATAIRAGQLSARDVLSGHLAQIATHNPALNDVITLDAERALERAREADDALARGENWGLLHGVPFTLKDAHATSGVRTTTGSRRSPTTCPKRMARLPRGSRLRAVFSSAKRTSR